MVTGSIAAIRSGIKSRRELGTLGLVPTMGALHAGHARLIEQARQECQTVVVSIFINPLQFDRREDLEKYPRTLPTDAELCEKLGVDLVFAPAPAEMYPTGSTLTVDPGRIADHLCGRHRPGHFRGVATVVLKLLNVIQPNRAYFGQKDAQQLAIIRRMVTDFDLPVEVVPVPTVREPDGLALSSRNQQLTPVERSLAGALYRALCEARRQIEAGVCDSAEVEKAATLQIPVDPLLRLEYLQVVDPDEMQPVGRIEGTVCVAGALWVGRTRLIDNVLV